MRTILKLVSAAAIAAPLAFATPADAQVATADLNAAVDQSAAMKAAAQQIQAQYKPQIDAFNARQQALQAQLQPLAQELQGLQGNPATAPATIQAKAAAFQQRRDAAQKELAGLSGAFQRPLAYAQEQLVDKLDEAVKAAMAAKSVTILIRPDAVFTALPAGDLTPDVIAQLNNQVKTVSITPPAGWQPGQQQQGGAGRPTPSNTQGR